MLTKKQRVEVAKDVLKQLRYKRIKVTPGEYVSVPMPESEVPALMDLGKNKREKSKNLAKKLFARKDCQVCARGAMFLSGIGLFNKLEISSSTGERVGWNKFVLKDETLDWTRDNFGNEQAALIENAFEGRNITTDYGEAGVDGYDFGADGFTITYRGPAVDFFNKYPDPVDRLRAIMKNIIKNEGVFKL